MSCWNEKGKRVWEWVSLTEVDLGAPAIAILLVAVTVQDRGAKRRDEAVAAGAGVLPTVRRSQETFPYMSRG